MAAESASGKDGGESTDEWPSTSDRLRPVIVGLSAVLTVILIALVILLVTKPVLKKASAPASVASATPGDSKPDLPSGWTQQAADTQVDCSVHSYGKVQQFLTANRCLGLRRLLSSVIQDGHEVLIASNAVSFSSPQIAASYLSLVSADGTGNISDLLREGARVPGATASRLPPTAAFASRREENRVIVAEAAYASGTTASGDGTLKALAALAIR